MLHPVPAVRILGDMSTTDFLTDTIADPSSIRFRYEHRTDGTVVAYWGGIEVTLTRATTGPDVWTASAADYSYRTPDLNPNRGRLYVAAGKGRRAAAIAATVAALQDRLDAIADPAPRPIRFFGGGPSGFKLVSD